MRSYSPDEFVSKLSSNELDDPSSVRIVGLASFDGDDPATLRFSTSPACENWLSLPTELIESIDHLRTVRCKDHEHPVVRVVLKSADDARPDVAFLLRLVSHLQGLVSLAERVARTRRSPKRSANVLRAGVGVPPCWMSEGPVGLEVCCYDDVNPDIACTGMV